MRVYVSLAAFLLFTSVGLAGTKPITVDAGGSADFKTIRDAVAAAPAGSKETVRIHIRAGKYQGPVVIPKEKTNILLQGDDPATTILTWHLNVYDPRPEAISNDRGVVQSAPALMVYGSDFTAIGLTIENTSGDRGQASAVRADSDRSIFVNCRITGWQDTLFVNKGRQYYRDCYISGRVDFIFGSATAWFENCKIHSRNGGYITAPNTPQEQPYGLVFNQCKLTGDAIPWDPATTNPATTQKVKITPKGDLGRPWRPYGSATFMRCDIGDHIKPGGWDNWRKVTNEKTARFSEYKNTGPGARPDQRVVWARQLTDDEAAKITIPNVLAGKDEWDPAAVAQSLGKK